MAFARFGHFRFNDATFNEHKKDSDALSRKDFTELVEEDKVFLEVGG